MKDISFCIAAATSQVRLFDSLWSSLLKLRDRAEYILDIFDNSCPEALTAYLEKTELLKKLGIDITIRVRNIGLLGESRNWAMSHATGTYIFVVDGDDYILPDNLIYLLDHLKLLPELPQIVLFSGWLIFEGKPTITTWGRDILPIVNTMNRSDFLDWFSEHGWKLTTACLKIYKTSWLKTEALRFIDNIYYEDTPFWFAVATAATSVRFIPIEIYAYRREWNYTQITANKGERLLDIIDVLTEMRKAVYAQGDERIRSAYHRFAVDHLRWSASMIRQSQISPRNKALFHDRSHSVLVESVPHVRNKGLLSFPFKEKFIFSCLEERSLHGGRNMCLALWRRLMRFRR